MITFLFQLETNQNQIKINALHGIGAVVPKFCLYILKYITMYTMTENIIYHQAYS